MDAGAYDPALVQRTVSRLRWLFGEHGYFPVSVRGLEDLPSAPVMLVMNHSGGTTIPDVWGFGVAWYAKFGVERPIHPLGHELIFATEHTARFFATRGVLHASRRVAADVVGHYRRDLLVMPGGDFDTWRPYRERWRVRFGGRSGFARVAISTGTPIVPVAHAGAHETLMVLTDGQRIARALRLPRLARAEVFPIHLSLPWGLAIGPWPHLPLPARLRYRVGAPIVPPAMPPGQDPPEAVATAFAARVEREVQRLLDELKLERG
jgi:1-acyl-sn-glycerol-3-phosphate acyltransferase